MGRRLERPDLIFRIGIGSDQSFGNEMGVNQICLNIVTNHVFEQFQTSCDGFGGPSHLSVIRGEGVWETGSKPPPPPPLQSCSEPRA